MARFRGPLFIVGMPRSGTKLLRTIMNNHSAIRILEVETECLPYWVSNWPRYGDLSQWRNFERFYRQVQNGTFMFLHRLEIGEPIDPQTWYNSCENFSPAGVFEALVRHNTRVPYTSDMIWGDKSPGYIRSIPLLKRLYPQARFLHIRRDVRDYCLSLNKALHKDMLRAAQRWADDIAGARQFGDRLGRDYLEVQYEELITDPHKVARQACALVERDFEPTMTSLNRPAEQAFEHFGGAGAGVNVILSDNMNKWRARLDDRMLRSIEEIAFDTMRSCHYQIALANRSRRLSSASLTMRQLLDGFNLVRTYHRWDLLTRFRFFWRAFVTASPGLKPWQRKTRL
jgi:hypothetical protein